MLGRNPDASVTVSEHCFVISEKTLKYERLVRKDEDVPFLGEWQREERDVM
jgi:hypothetical protein